MQIAEENWIHTVLTPDNIPINQYYLDHPHMMLGKMAFDTRMYGENGKYTTLLNDNSEDF